MTDIANDPVYVQSALSERLANAGLLPMFGFPTRTRYLFHGDPRRSREWPPKETVDRDLDLAISQFAPGAETVKDGVVHAAVGVAHYERRGQQVVPVSDPLGAPTPLGTCRTCQAVVLRPAPQTTLCPVCASPAFEIVQLAQPRGFQDLVRRVLGFRRHFRMDAACVTAQDRPWPSANADCGKLRILV